MDIYEKVEYWLELAMYDLETAKIVLKAKRYLHFGFLCHLSSEKLLKAYYWKYIGEEPPYTHNLLVLSSKSGLDSLISASHKQLLYKLMPLNVEARYPIEKKEIFKTLNRQYCENIYKDLKEFSLWMKQLLKK
ncbi:MAG: HEPN domain-containing protein [Bacteroidetes bacterium]|nr:HEPN domain-containing protein [Bacteroidota bacterium]